MQYLDGPSNDPSYRISAVQAFRSFMFARSCIIAILFSKALLAMHLYFEGHRIFGGLLNLKYSIGGLLLLRL